MGESTANHASTTVKGSRGAILTLQAPSPPLKSTGSLTHFFFSYFLFIPEKILQIFIRHYFCAGAIGEVTPNQLPVLKSSQTETCVNPFQQ